MTRQEPTSNCPGAARHLRSALGLSALLLVACADGVSGADTGRRDASNPDAGTDAGMDAGMDAAFDAAVSGDCVGRAEGTPCDADGNGCTMDLCRGGRCVLGGPADCDDGVSCTMDGCVSTGPMTYRCTNEVAGNSCVIEGICVADGAANPADTCQVCDASRPDAWSPQTGPCDDGDACTTGDSCATGSCVGTPRLDSYEPNDGRGSASRLPGVSDRDAFGSADTIRPSIYPEGDVDWFVYNDSDDFGGSIFPRVELRDIPSGSNYDLCVYLDCESSFVSITCTIGTRGAEMGGLPSCCSMQSGNADEIVRIDHDCSSSDDSADLYVAVVKVEGPASCETPYSLTYGDD